MKILAALALFVCLAGVGAHGAMITFDSLNGRNGYPYPGSTEGNFSIVSASGQWVEAHVHGNPVPSIYGRSDVGVVHVTEDTTGVFNFISVELDHAHVSGSGPGQYAIEGFLDGASVFQTAGTMPLDFGIIASPDPSETIDLLTITMYKGTVPYNIDNVNVETVPEPATLLLFAIGTALTVKSRKR